MDDDILRELDDFDLEETEIIKFRTYDEAKNAFIIKYKDFKNLDDIYCVTRDIVIPFFECFSCDLDEIIDSINREHNVNNESLDYIENIFSQKLYESITSTMDENRDMYIHFNIISIEYVKYCRYKRIASRLEELVLAASSESMELYNIMVQANNERKDICLQRMKNYNNDLINYPNYEHSRMSVEILLSTNDIKL
jgi:uncharacterized protein YueI